jgi:hypothetical protein
LWFQGPDRAISENSRDEIRKALKRVYKNGFKESRVGFECESSSNSKCDRANAYVYTDWLTRHTTGSDIHLCPSFFEKSIMRQEAIILHEMSHEYAYTDDEFYYDSPASPLARDEETTTLRKNADTYEEFLLEAYIEFGVLIEAVGQ